MSMMGDYNKYLNIIPIDMTANLILAAGWYCAGTYETKMKNGNHQIVVPVSSEFGRQNIILNDNNQNYPDTTFIPVFNCTIENE